MALRRVRGRHLARGEHDAAAGERDAGELDRARPLAGQRPARTGIATPVAEIGATTLIVPIESAR